MDGVEFSLDVCLSRDKTDERRRALRSTVGLEIGSSGDRAGSAGGVRCVSTRARAATSSRWNIAVGFGACWGS